MATRQTDMTLSQLIDALTALRDTHGDDPVHVAGGRPIRSVTVKQEPPPGTDARVLLHQAPDLYYRNWDKVVFRDHKVAGFIRKVDDRYEAVATTTGDGRPSGLLGDAATIRGALALFDQGD